MSFLSVEIIHSVLTHALPWSAPRADGGKLVPLGKDAFDVGGYYGRFEAGDFVFVNTRKPKESAVRPAIYVVTKVREFSRKEGFEIYWELRLIGGYGTSKISLYYQHPYGQNPGAYTENWFPDLGHGKNMPKLNYYVDKVVRKGKTVWDVGDQLAQYED